MIQEVAVAVVVTLIVGDAARSARWSSAKLARWAARQIYAADQTRAGERAEEWEALITETIPSDISAFCFGAALAVTASAHAASRHAARAWRSMARLPGFRRIRPNESSWRLDEIRQASLSLLSAVIQFRLLLTDPESRSQEYLDGHHREFRRLAAEARLQAVNIAMLSPAELAESAQSLARTADIIAGHATASVSRAHLTELDERTTVFQNTAIVVLRALFDPVDAASAENLICPGQANE
jgi:hypothetical protein